MKKIDIIQALRGIAAMLVVMLHVRIMFNFDSRNLGNRFFGNGGIGVDLFFIISGFIMVYTSQEKSGTKSTIHFIINRITRVLPLYLILTAFFRTFVNTDGHWWTGNGNFAGFVKAMLFLPTNLHDISPFFGFPPLFVGWTLQYEMFFYMIFGIALLFGRWRWWFIAAVFSMLLVVIPLATGHFRTDALQNVDYRLAYFNFATNPMLFEFVIGIAIARIFMSDFTIPRIPAMIFVAFAVAVFICQYGAEMGENPYHGPFRWGIGCSLLVFSLLMLTKVVELHIPRFAVFLGNISYSVYLVHIIIVLGLISLLRRFHLPEFTTHWGYFFIYLPLVLFTAYATYSLIEQRLSNWIKAKILGLPLHKAK